MTVQARSKRKVWKSTSGRWSVTDVDEYGYKGAVFVFDTWQRAMAFALHRGNPRSTLAERLIARGLM